MAQYTEADVQNALADIANGIAVATAGTQHGVLRTTLRDRISGTQHHKNASSYLASCTEHLGGTWSGSAEVAGGADRENGAAARTAPIT